MKARIAGLKTAAPVTGSCVALENHGTHSTVKLRVGSPIADDTAQVFNVVPDTGSDFTIVPSCLCKSSGHCLEEDNCFTGTNRSATFKLKKFSKDGSPSYDGIIRSDDIISDIQITFGSGPIEAVIATDFVQVGSVRALMNESLLLMVDNHLHIGSFEGILGLGLPAPPASAPLASGNASDASSMPTGFLETANISHFSICFNDAMNGTSQDGALRLGPSMPADAIMLGSIGTVHWGLDFRGISVGSATAEVAFCGASDKHGPNQKTACGIIPDSGSTLMMGDKKHLVKLFDQLCDQWDRCSQRATALPGMHKHEVFQEVLADCDQWSVDGNLSEMPSIHFHVAGADGTEQVLELSGFDYVLESDKEEMEVIRASVWGIRVELEIPTDRRRKVCSPAFAAMPYNTEANGPVWVFGTPLFYKFQVFYDLKASPPAMAFVSAPCGSCSSPASLLTASIVSRKSANSGEGRVRQFHGRMRLPSLNTSLPL